MEAGVCKEYSGETSGQGAAKKVSRTTSEKRGVPSHTEGERILEMLCRVQMH